jgi:hypothetical protein
VDTKTVRADQRGDVVKRRTQRRCFVKRWRTGLLVGIVALLASSNVASANPRAAVAVLQPTDRSGIRAAMLFVDTGTELQVRGAARRLDPAKTYISLIYDSGAVARGPNACLPSRTPSPLTSEQMLVGSWLPMGSSTRTLTAVKSGASYTAVSSFAAVSIRVVGDAPQPILQACGKVRSIDELDRDRD